MIDDRLIYETRRGFVVDLTDAKRLMAKGDIRNGKVYKNGMPSDETVHLFRAKHREFPYRKHEYKDKAKVHAESFNHVDPFFKIFETICESKQGLLSDGNRMWNLDETDVNAFFGARVKVFSDAKSQQGRSRSSHVTGGNGRHVPLVIAASASGQICPSFFIVEGKNIIESLFQPLPAEMFEGMPSSIVQRLTSPGWFPTNAAIFMSNSGSMNMDILRLFITYLNNHVRNVIPREEKYLLTLDRHGSRKGIEWVEECMKVSFEVVLAPANTSHFPQPCDQDINKRYKHEFRSVGDELFNIATCDHRDIQVKLMCAVIAHERITKQDFAIAFCKTGLFPFVRNFRERSRRSTIDLTSRGDEEGSGGNIEATTAETACVIVRTETDDSRMLQRLSYLLKTSETTNKVLMSHAPRGSVTSTSTSTSSNRAVLCSRAPAEYLTINDAIERKRKAASEGTRSS